MNHENPFDNRDVKHYTANTFGESVRQRRKQMGISIRQMAKSVGMSPIYLSEIERGHRAAPSGVLSKIDYMSALAKELDLTESQKKVFETMAQLTYMKKIKVLDNYFINNPSALKFFIMAVEEKFDNDKWDELYNSTFER